MNALTETLGVLYGSVEYWSNSNNVDSWSDIQLSYTSTESATLQNRVGTNHGNNKRRKKENYRDQNGFKPLLQLMPRAL